MKKMIDRKPDWIETVENGMGITMGRLRKGKNFNWKFITLSHNTIRGAAGGAILMAELLNQERIYFMKIKILVPATSANLGAGFDVFGIAVDLFNEFIVEDAEKFEIVIPKAHVRIPSTKDNLFYKSYSYLFKKAKKKVPSVKITMNLQIPPARGLGSSATAVVGGLTAANAFTNNRFTKDQLLAYALELEVGNNPDNVAPALLGGLVILAKDNNNLHWEPSLFQKLLKLFILFLISKWILSKGESLCRVIIQKKMRFSQQAE